MTKTEPRKRPTTQSTGRMLGSGVDPGDFAKMVERTDAGEDWVNVFGGLNGRMPRLRCASDPLGPWARTRETSVLLAPSTCDNFGCRSRGRSSVG